MPQLSFDHWFNMHTDTSYADRCRRKKQLRQRKIPSGNYQVDEDVWARHPSNDIMYIASVTAVNNYQRTCVVTFIDSGQTFNLPLSHLRHVTREDIQRNRYVDYGHSWSDRTSIGTIYTYDRYGELQRIQYTGISKVIFDDSFTAEDNDCINDATINDISLSNDTTKAEVYIQDSRSNSKNEPIWIRIPDPEEPTATYCNCPVWNTTSYEEAEKKAFALCNEDVEYVKAVQRAQHRMETTQQLLQFHPEELIASQTPEVLAQTEIYPVEPGPLPSNNISVNSSTQSLSDPVKPVLISDNMSENLQHLPSNIHKNDTKQSNDSWKIISSEVVQSDATLKGYDTLTDELLNKSDNQQLLFDNVQEEKSQAATALHVSNDLSNVNKFNEQAQSISTPPMTYVRRTEKLLLPCDSYQSMRYSQTLTIGSTKTTKTSLKSIVVITLIIILSYHLIIESSLTEKNVNSSLFIKNCMILLDTVHRFNIILFILSTISFSSNMNGPSRSLLELWCYPFAVP